MPYQRRKYKMFYKIDELDTRCNLIGFFNTKRRRFLQTLMWFVFSRFQSTEYKFMVKNYSFFLFYMTIIYYMISLGVVLSWNQLQFRIALDALQQHLEHRPLLGQCGKSKHRQSCKWQFANEQIHCCSRVFPVSKHTTIWFVALSCLWFVFRNDFTLHFVYNLKNNLCNSFLQSNVNNFCVMQVELHGINQIVNRISKIPILRFSSFFVRMCCRKTLTMFLSIPALVFNKIASKSFFFLWHVAEKFWNCSTVKDFNPWDSPSGNWCCAC